MRSLSRVKGLMFLTTTSDTGSKIITQNIHKRSICLTKKYGPVSNSNALPLLTTIQQRQRYTTYNEEEVAKFRAMAASWWDPKGDCRPLHSLNELRVALIRDGLIQTGAVNEKEEMGPKPLNGLKILDVGCGGGILCEPLGRLGATVLGLDAAEENVSVANVHLEKQSNLVKNVSYACGTIEEHAEQTDVQYDAIVASEVLEHVEAVDFFIASCSKILKPGGSLFITTINRTTLSWLGAIIAAEYILKLLPVGTHDWNKFITTQEMSFTLERCGFSMKSMRGMGYNPIINKWFWQNNQDVNYACHAIKVDDGNIQ